MTLSSFDFNQAEELKPTRIQKISSTDFNETSSATVISAEGSDNTSDTKSVLWEQTAESLRHVLDPQIFAAWIKPLTVRDISFSSDGASALRASLVAPNKFCAEHVERHYGESICSALKRVSDSGSVALSISAVRQQASTADKRVAKRTTQTSSSTAAGSSPAQTTEGGTASRSRRRGATRSMTSLNPKYNFSNFVVGGCNQFAHAVSLRVSEQPGSAYNPLFIYGGVGLGKTHLVNAIGNAAARRGKNVLLVSSETFVNELITALRSNRMLQFKERFRSLDILIIDDIQFIIGKECTQEEFFHTFNALHQRHSQIILTSDKTPQELTGLEERLRTRFSSGLAADLQTPDFETRVAILIKKAEMLTIALPDEVAQFLAEKIDSNVRELEGALNRLHAVSMMHESPLTLDLAESALRTIVPERTREITIEYIQKVVSEHYNIGAKDIIGKRRTQNIAFPRQIAMYLCRRMTTCSYPEIGALFGGRDHSTVIHANRVISKRRTESPTFCTEIERLERKLKGL
ncbi:MAG: chromosomal replication initiator protein DnaA [Bdellovibrionales bacterium]|nr:chromosomal replication initiator protein DnaA [Bdellovibrionales bacterium]